VRLDAASGQEDQERQKRRQAGRPAAV